ncbi:hypothetical protein VTK73DRAFT_8727 [Phialemonium thermophilum]|uniref:RCC1-like domain-containing protein n=1 Tax=Phialemonium thermophilum TaxID=223376 RepID=A0ABR3XP30_9PEZI
MPSKTPPSRSLRNRSSRKFTKMALDVTASKAKKRRLSPETQDDTIEKNEHPAKINRRHELAKSTVPATTKARVKGRATVSQRAAPDPVINKAPADVLTVLVFGNGDNGELGLGPQQREALRPRVNPYFDPHDPSKFHVVQIACGGMHTVALTATNDIVTWGVNDNYALGRDTHWDETLRDIDFDSDDGELNPLESCPAKIPAEHFPPETRFVQVAAGDSCSFVLTETGLVYGWGTFRDSNGDERFGYDSEGGLVRKQKTPVLIQGVQKVTQIACGVNHVLALDVAGNIWAWGSNEQNQFGRRLFGRDQDNLRPHQVRVCRNNAKYVASGEYHSFAVDRHDNVWAWGLNSYGEAGYTKTAGANSAILPYPRKISSLCGKSVIALAGGAHHSAAVTDDGQCLVWGRMDGGQLGISFTPQQQEDSTLIRFNDRNQPAICLRPTLVPEIGHAVWVACGTDHTIFVNKDGSAYASGFGSEGQLGLGSTDDAEVAQLIKGQALKDKVLTWAGAGGQFSIVAGPASIR